MTNQTIAAIATPLGPGGIGIIRISGPEAYEILQRLFLQPGQDVRQTYSDAVNACFLPRTVYYGHIVEPGTDKIIDEVLAIYMRRPRSFTREDVVEIHSHSGFIVLDRILSAIIDAGAELAEPGEFTKRAFLNGRIDLSQAEAVIDLINAPCETAARIATQQIQGGLRLTINQIYKKISKLQAIVEADIEFGEEVETGLVERELDDEIRREVLPEIENLVQRHEETNIYQEGLHLAIGGVPNVGKSSLLNRLVEKEAAIVSAVPGTTRDIVREFISINGVPVVICDTAGIHETADPVECIGIKKARDQIHKANIVLMVVDASRYLESYEEKLVEELADAKSIIVINKDDIGDSVALLEIEKKFSSLNTIRVSAKHGTNIEALKTLILKDYLYKKNDEGASWITPNLRQRKILERAKIELQALLQFKRSRDSVEMISGTLNTVLGCLEEITGNRNKENLYDQIFSQFCIGK